MSCAGIAASCVLLLCHVLILSTKATACERRYPTVLFRTTTLLTSTTVVVL